MAGNQFVSFTVNGIAGADTVSFADLEISLLDCAGTTGSMIAFAEDDNGQGIVGGNASFGGVVPGDQLINACVSALDLSVISDEANNDTLVLQSDGSLSPNGYLGALAYTVNRDAIINGNDDFLTSVCLDQVDFAVAQTIGSTNGILSADVAVRSGETAFFDASGVARFSFTDERDFRDLLNSSFDVIHVNENGGSIAATATSVINSVASFGTACGVFIPSESHIGGLLDTIDTPGTETFGTYDWVGGSAASATRSVFRATSNGAALPPVAIPFIVELTNASPASANGEYAGFVTPVEGQIMLDSAAFGVPGLVYDYADVQLSFQLGDDSTTNLDVDRLVVTSTGGSTAYADGANDVIPVGQAVSTDVEDAQNDVNFVPVP